MLACVCVCVHPGRSQLPVASCNIKIKTKPEMLPGAGTAHTHVRHSSCKDSNSVKTAPSAGNAFSMSFANANVYTQLRNKQTHTMCAYFNVSVPVSVHLNALVCA